MNCFGYCLSGTKALCHYACKSVGGQLSDCVRNCSESENEKILVLSRLHTTEFIFNLYEIEHLKDWSSMLKKNFFSFFN